MTEQPTTAPVAPVIPVPPWMRTLAVAGVSIISAITGAGLTYFVEDKKVELDEFNRIVATWEGDNNRLRLENARILETNIELREQLIELRHQMSDLRAKMIVLESAHADSPIPTWLKDTSGQVLAINRAYETIFLLPRGYEADDYVGHDDYSVWPESVADAFRRHDAAVLQSGHPWRGQEFVQRADGTLQPWNIIKWPRTAGGIIVGIAGMAFPVQWIAEPSDDTAGTHEFLGNANMHPR